MPSTRTKVEHIGEVVVSKRKGLKNMTLRVASDGTVKLSLPWYVPKAAGMSFVRKKADWIRSQQNARKTNLNDGSFIGKWRLRIIHSKDKKSWVIDDKHITIFCDNDHNFIRLGIKKALRKEAEKYLPQRLAHLADEHGFSYKKVRLSSASSRWGSCSESGTISLNIHLMRLPSNLIDYVLLHELCHTKEMNHSKKFWQLVEKYDPHHKQHRKALKFHRLHI